uniref:Uncharacterized protein n=1 Tax=Thermosporothrix sp. COM3 TaxID=2490863 RepID=A0A455SVJ6_9CHLR|nr:hypothetical protein KTC_64410 [Thermosporothrix sp. COM3]
MSNNIEYTNLTLANSDYGNLLEKIEKLLDEELKRIQTAGKGNYFGITPYPAFDIDKLAEAMAKQFIGSNQYPFENIDGTAFATVYMPEVEAQQKFSQQLHSILRKMQRCMQSLYFKQPNAPKQQTPNALHIYMKKFVEEITKTLSSSSLSSQTGSQMHGLTYGSFTTPFDVKKRRLSVTKNPESSEVGEKVWLKGHKLTVQVQNIGQFDQDVIDGIMTRLKQMREAGEELDDESLSDVQDELKRKAAAPTSDLQALRNAVIVETVARIFRECKVRYLQYLLNGMKVWNKPGKERGMRLLENLIARLRALDEYSRAYDLGHYEVTFQQRTYNFKEILSGAAAFDSLPIITEIEGLLNETTDVQQGIKTFIMGVKLKLNGKVQVHGGKNDTVFDYNISLLDPQTPLYKRRKAAAIDEERFYEKVLHVALLYLVLVRLDDPTFDAVAFFEEKIRPVLQNGSEEEKLDVLLKIKRGIEAGKKAEEYIRTLKDLLVEFIKHQSIGPDMAPETLVLSLKTSLLNTDLDSIVNSHIYFQEFVPQQSKSVLKHVAVEEARTSNDALCKLPLQIQFEPLYYYPADTLEEVYTMKYTATQLKTLPVMLVPVDNSGYLRDIKNSFGKLNRIALYYRHHTWYSDSPEAFVYRFTYITLAYIFVKMLASYAVGKGEDPSLFLPILCIHDRDEAEADVNRHDETVHKEEEQKTVQLSDEAFIHSFAKLLDFLLSQDYLSSSQGFKRDTIQGAKQGIHKRRNALASLFSALPRSFEKQLAQPNRDYALKKLALVIVSSRPSDKNRKAQEPDSTEGATLYGQIVGIERLDTGAIRLGLLTTFSANLEKEELYSRPQALIDQLRKYAAQGYSHFLYVAHAPYNRTLKVEQLDLYFMNESVIQALREIPAGEKGEHIRVYPIFCDKYYVVNRKPRARSSVPDVNSLYIDDIGELAQVSRDTSKKAILFFNIFTGKTINPESVYNGVMSYTTLVNTYQNDVTYDQYIWSDLLSLSSENSLRAEILEMLTLFHFWRFEKGNEIRNVNKTGKDKRIQIQMKLDPYSQIIGTDSVGKLSIYPHMRSKVRFNALSYLTEVRSVLRKQKNEGER